MSSKTLEEKAVDILDTVGQNLGNMTEKLAQLARDHGEQAIDLLNAVVRIHNFSSIVTGIMLLVISYTTYRFSRYVFRPHWLNTPPDLHSNDVDARTGWALLTIIAGVVSAITGIVSQFWLFSLWTWVGIFWPHVWLAKKAVDLVIK